MYSHFADWQAVVPWEKKNNSSKLHRINPLCDKRMHSKISLSALGDNKRMLAEISCFNTFIKNVCGKCCVVNN